MSVEPALFPRFVRRISVIVPTLDEAETLAPLIEALKREPELLEIVVADSSSADGTPTLAQAMDCHVIVAERGRGQALRAGAAKARGEILLFLHADSVLSPGSLGAIAAILERDVNCPGGNFRLLFDGRHRFARWLTAVYPQLRRFGLYYGDSGIFVRRAAYDAIGGIKPIAIMEDYDFVRRLERVGRTCRIEDPPLITSSRQLATRHPLVIVALCCVIHILYALGVPPAWLASLYYPRRRRRRSTDAVLRKHIAKI